MGEVADDIINGSCCQTCYEYFDNIIDGDKPPGYPRTCLACDDYEQEDDFLEE